MTSTALPSHNTAETMVLEAARVAFAGSVQSVIGFLAAD
jgi:hypothetical protein